jgi:hypothetical protein
MPKKKSSNVTKIKYHKPTTDEINEIINSTIPENTRKATAKWVGILETWRLEVGYEYGIETITDKDKLEHEMIEFILGIRQIRSQQEYSPSSLINCIRLLSIYILKHPKAINKYNIGNRKEFAQLWEALNGKMKQLKKKGIISRHHDHLTDEELKKIFQHDAVTSNTPQGLIYRIFMWCCLLFQPRGGEHYKISIAQFTFLSNGGIQFVKNYQKNDQGGVNGSSDSLMIPVPPDPEDYQGPVYDFKYFFSKRPMNSKCESLYLHINKEIKGKNIRTCSFFFFK